MFVDAVSKMLSSSNYYVTKNIAKSLKRLSTGSSVNSAEDSGYLLARKSREVAQKKSLESFANNISDRISLNSQEDESLQEISSILSRMKELAISASTSSVTQSDRAEINDELSLLRTEVENITKSTSYNTKKLLNGSMGAIVTSSNQNVKGCATASAKNGTHKIEISYITASKTDNHILTTNIFSVKEGIESVSNKEFNGNKATVNVTASFSTDTGTLTFNFDGTEYSIALSSQNTTNVVDKLNNDANISTYILASTVDSNTISITSRDSGSDKNSWTVVSDYPAPATTATYSLSGGSDSANGITDVGNPQELLSGADGTASYTVVLNPSVASSTESASDTFVIARYEQSDSTTGAITIFSGSVTAPSGGGNLLVEIQSSATLTTASGSFEMRYSFDGTNWSTYTMNSDYFKDGGVLLSDGSASVSLGNTAITTMKVNSDDKHLFGLVDKNYNPSGNHIELQISAPVNDGTGNGVQNSTIFSRTNSDVESGTRTFTINQLDTTNGTWVHGTIDLQFSAIVTTATTSDKVLFDIEQSGGVANSMTKLSAIGTFFDDNGSFVLSDSGNSLTISTKQGKSATINFLPSDSVEDLRTRLVSAVSTLFDVSMNESAKNNLVSFVTSATSGTSENSAGKFVVRSPLPGEEGMLYFSAQTDAIENAFSFSSYQTPSKSPYEISIDKKVENLSSNRVSNSISGVELEVNPDKSVKLSWSGKDKNFVANQNEIIKADLNVKNNSQQFLASIYGGTESFAYPDFTVESLGLDKISLTSEDLSDRAQTIIDNAMDKMNRFLGKLGGEMEKVAYKEDLNNTNIALKTATISSLFDTDIAKEYTELTKNMLLQSTINSLLNKSFSANASLWKLITG